MLEFPQESCYINKNDIIYINNNTVTIQMNIHFWNTKSLTGFKNWVFPNHIK